MLKTICSCVLKYTKSITISRMPFYAVKIGRNPGVYTTWAQCENEVKQFPKARYKKFDTEAEARQFAFDGEGSSSYSNSRPASSVNSNSSFTANSHQNLATFGDLLSNPLLDLSTTDVKSLSLQAAKDKLTSVHQNIGKLTSLSIQLQSRIDDLESGSSGPQSAVTHNTQNINVNQNVPPFGGQRTNNSGQNNYNKQGKKGKRKGAILLNEVPKRFKSTAAPDAGQIGDTWIVYTDGCCYNNGKNGARAGIGVYWGPNHHMNVSERLSGRPTNNRAEIHAACKAIHQAKTMGVRNLKLHTDSQFLINSITKWIKGWKRNGWMLTSGEPVVNRADFEELDFEMRGIKVEWVHVRGHQGIAGNEAADQLANEGSKKPL